MAIFESKRLLFRELDFSDSEAFYHLNSDPEVLKYTGDKAFSSILEAELFLKNYADYKTNGFGRWAVITKDSNEFIGWCGLKRNEEKAIDLGFRFFKNQWGKGYATESAKASLHYGFKELRINEIIGRASIENKASIRVLEKLKMKFWKNASCKGIENSVYYKLNKAEYNERYNS